MLKSAQLCWRCTSALRSPDGLDNKPGDQGLCFCLLHVLHRQLLYYFFFCPKISTADQKDYFLGKNKNKKIKMIQLPKLSFPYFSRKLKVYKQFQIFIRDIALTGVEELSSTFNHQAIVAMTYERVEGLFCCFTERKCAVCAEPEDPRSSTTMQNAISIILLDAGDYLESTQTLLLEMGLKDK